MNKIILDANEGLVNPAFDRFMDGNPTRREIQKAMDHFSSMLDQAFASIDTQHIVINMIAEKLGITTGEITAYAKRKAEEVKAYAAKEQASVPSNG